MWVDAVNPTLIASSRGDGSGDGSGDDARGPSSRYTSVAPLSFCGVPIKI